MFAGTEIPSGSGDLQSLPEKDAVGGCWPIDARSDRSSTKITGPGPVNHEQALHTRQLADPATVGTSAIADVAFHLKPHVRGDRETALTHSGCAEVLW